METLDLLIDGFKVALTLENFTLALIGCILGTIFGALPGLGPANGVAILIPLSFSLGLSAAASMICLLYTSPSPRDGLLSRMPSSA